MIQESIGAIGASGTGVATRTTELWLVYSIGVIPADPWQRKCDRGDIIVKHAGLLTAVLRPACPRPDEHVISLPQSHYRGQKRSVFYYRGMMSPLSHFRDHGSAAITPMVYSQILPYGHPIFTYGLQSDLARGKSISITLQVPTRKK